jgi:integrase
VEGGIRAKRTPDVPGVLSRAEMATILPYVPPPSELVVKRWYGGGLRLSACLNLRVHCFNVDAGVLTIHDGKGQKDRTVPLPATMLPALRAPLASLKDLHPRDLEQDDAGVLLVNACERT